MRLTGESRPIVRANVPPPEPFVDPRMGEDGMEWHEDGADVPDWAVGAAISVVGVLVLMVLAMVLAALPANQPDGPGPSATPTTYGPPVGW